MFPPPQATVVLWLPCLASGTHSLPVLRLTAFSSPLGSSSLAGMLSSLHLQCSPWLTSATLPVTERKDTVIVLKLLTAQGARQKLNSCSSAWWQGQGAAPSTSTNMGRAPRLGGKGVGQGRPPQGDVALT